jgi:hypothetical protein
MAQPQRLNIKQRHQESGKIAVPMSILGSTKVKCLIMLFDDAVCLSNLISQVEK